jgi:NAD(P)-dependent dehydrogenase (short-subunit alcohol dehydrogenase family)
VSELTDHISPKHALVTGGGRGIGRLVAQAFAAEGMAVGLIARSENELAETVALIEATGGIAAAEVADVSDEWSTGIAVERLRDRLGPVEVLINNAGIVGPIGPTWEVDPDQWWRTMEVNLRGILITSQLVFPEMVLRRTGRIVNLSSHAGVFRWPLVSAYSVSKAAVVKLSENMALEARRHNIAVFSVHPGLLPIGMAEQAYATSASPESDEAHVFAWIRQEIAEGRGADPERAIDLLVRLASGEYDELSGLQISVHDDLDALLAQTERISRSSVA